MKTWWLCPIALLLMAAAPPRQFSLAIPSDGGGFSLPTNQPPSFSLGGTPAGRRFEPAPLPNRDLNAPRATRTSNEPSLSPTLFTNHTQYRGDGFSPGSTPQGEQEHRLHPAAGFSLHMPLQPQ